jgi:hypothetical protein
MKKRARVDLYHAFRSPHGLVLLHKLVLTALWGHDRQGDVP